MLARFQDALVILLLVAALISAGLWLAEGAMPLQRELARVGRLLGIVVLAIAAVIYVPFLQQAFSTESLDVRDWLVCVAVASSVVWLQELGKLVGPYWPGSPALDTHGIPRVPPV